MGYKILGFVVWQGGKWYVRRRMPGLGRKAAIGGLAAAAAVGGAVAVQRQQSSS
jgi:hypothetical protein